MLFFKLYQRDSMTPTALDLYVVEQFTKADRDACHALCKKGKDHATLRRLSSTVKPDAARGLNGRRLYPSACQPARAQPNNRLEPTRKSQSKLCSNLAAHPPAVLWRN